MEKALQQDGKKLVLPEHIRLRAEVLQLKTHNTQLQLQVLQADVQKALQARSALAEEAEKFRQSVIEEFGVDLASAQVLQDGTVVQPSPVGTSR